MYTECAIAIENVHRMTRSHATIDVRRIRPDVREFRDKRMMGSEVAHRVRCGGITGEREGAAAGLAEKLKSQERYDRRLARRRRR